MTSPITIKSPTSKRDIVGYPVAKNGARGFLITKYVNAVDNTADHIKQEGYCYGLLLSDNIKVFIRKHGWDASEKISKKDPARLLYTKLSRYFNNAGSVNDLQGWYIYDGEFSEADVEGWIVCDSSSVLDTALFTDLL